MFDFTLGTPPDFNERGPLKSAEGTDRVHSLMLSAGISKIAEKLDLQFSYDFNHARALYEYIAGAVAKGYEERLAEQVFDLIEPFAGYAFNKSHAFCYAFVAYQTAYLKANYPVEWMAAVLTTDVAKPEKIVSALGECRQLEIEILMPNINYSQVRFTVERVAVKPGAMATAPKVPCEVVDG